MRAAAVVAAVLCACVPALAGPSTHVSVLVERVAFLMGTRATLAIHAADRATGLETLEQALRILEDTEQELSTWRADSALSRLNRAPVGSAWRADAALCRTLADVRRWSLETNGAFDAAVGRLLSAWAVHDGGRVPSPRELADARAKSGMHLVDIDDTCVITRRADVTLDAGAFGKGEALDRVAARFAGQPWLIDLGGQVSVGATSPGGAPWVIDIAHPIHRDRPALRVAIASGSLSTSGGSERDSAADGVRVGHILDPRSGRPATFDGSVTVWHERGIVADILSTALYVMGPDAGLPWAEARGLSVCYLVPDGETVTPRATPAFRALRR